MFLEVSTVCIQRKELDMNIFKEDCYFPICVHLFGIHGRACFAVGLVGIFVEDGRVVLLLYRARFLFYYHIISTYHCCQNVCYIYGCEMLLILFEITCSLENIIYWHCLGTSYYIVKDR